jgi:hypothetical protein
MFPPLSWSVITLLYEWSEENKSEFPFLEAEIGSVYTFAEGYGTAASVMVS